MISALTLLCALTLQAAAPGGQSPTAIEIPEGARVEILHQAGLVRVRVGAAKTLTYTAGAPVHVERTSRVLQIRPRNPRAVDATELTVTVPAGTNLRIDGWFPSVDVSGPVGSLQIHTREGRVSVSGGAAGAQIKTVNGHVEVIDTRGAVSIDSTAGDITLTSLAGDVRVAGTSGKVSIAKSRMTSLDVSMLSSHITFEGVLAPAGRYTIASHTGDVSLTLPPDASATVSFLTLQGRARITPAVAPQEEPTRSNQLRRRVFRIGGGAVGVDVRTFSGNLTIVWGAR